MNLLKRLFGKAPESEHPTSPIGSPPDTVALLIVNARTQISHEQFHPAELRPVFEQLYLDFPGLKLTKTPEIIVDAADTTRWTLAFTVCHPASLSTVSIQSRLVSLLDRVGFSPD